jgi:hypothetical protein
VLTVQAAKRSSDDLQRAFRLPLDADEATGAGPHDRSTARPQMAVLRIATLTPLVPLDEPPRSGPSARARQGGAPASAASGGRRGGTTPTRATSAGRPRRTRRRRRRADDGRVGRVAARVQAERVSLFMALRPLDRWDSRTTCSHRAR